jgi:membrane protein implicated in regulation of membrane protease activity
MACHGVKNKGDVPLRRSWGGYIVGAPATLPLCHYWTGVVSLSPYVFCLSIQGKREQKRRVAKREEEKKKNRKKTERERKKKQRRRKKNKR